MTTVIITKGLPEEIIKGIVPYVKFREVNRHQVFFNVKEATFQKIYNEVKTLGYNPFALMYWQ